MEKPFIALILYAVVALGLLVLIYTPRETHSHHHRRLKLRSNFSFSASPRAGPGTMRSHSIPSSSTLSSAGRTGKDFINDEDRFNVSLRLVSLFPSIDVSPEDGFLTVDELTRWNLRLEASETLHRTKRDMELHDKNHDGFVSFKEYDPPSWMRDHSDDHNSTGSHGWWSEEHFNASDIDGDGLLNLTEFNDFLHPSDSVNPKLILWLCKEEIRQRDRDKDGKLNFQEYFSGLFDSIRDFNEHDHNASSDRSSEFLAKKLFSEIDHDNDGLLSEEELKSVIGIIHPSEHYYAKQQAERAVEEADSDKDGRLSLKEMIDSPYAFYRAIFADGDESDYEFHDELR
ncbi:unnamed protein product [Spirodela intermedia]|uniref:EF-hand domain-containing protein n=1 Tax=Spirodela intermedia TaxID=51605 RepID=A0A7I8J7T6_SPIIN|nr:unnamed protein product [Spirodela intermedia]CAA6666144.1 unnamed protein product [Spirodela intermedia]